MRWSQLKKRTEENFAKSLKGRLEVFSTRYRESHDQEGEGWICFDKEKIYQFASVTYLIEEYKRETKIRSKFGNIDFGNPDQQEGYYAACREVKVDMTNSGIFPLWDFNRALFEFLNTSIDVALKSENPIIRAIAIVDKRFGKRRLIDYDVSDEHPFVQIMYEIRMRAEGIKRKDN